MKKRSSLPEEDDGRTIVNMNVEGMPGYIPRDHVFGKINTRESEPMSKAQMRAYRWAAVKAGLLVVLIFGVVYGLFIAFCDFVWFK